MERRNNNPGAVQYGNFMNYYQFTCAADRLKLVPDYVWLPDDNKLTADVAPYLLLDVGCNCGVLTQLLHSFVTRCVGREVHVLGVDIDPLLIERAKLENTSPEQIKYNCVDVMDENAFEQEIVGFLKQYNRKKFDAICCFSITMWVHLNHHDTGLQLFLRKLSQLAELFVVEPQPWKCYMAAVRRMNAADDGFPLFAQLQWRRNVDELIQDYLTLMLDRKQIYESAPTKWQRSILFYR
ncbi:probable RNA methyltransferase CG11342 [Scaptodrosophila lebanonensis]|uniref:RNA methyltransferase n=1 Tax=Drosophila lebanonensis TaxID=7225 RepID=A0A6J2UF42_DROLE|nr:probable RNA methyltransferase CG11342 [Scaptodrosophila lebanonensis]